MQVIAKGRKQMGWARRLLCTGKGNGMGGCGALLLVEEDDLYETSSHARDETTYYVTFKCCECMVQTDVVGVPGHIKAKLKVG